MLGVVIWLVLDHLHPLPTFTLFVTVFTDHVQLANPILQDRHKQTEKLHIRLIVLLHLVRQLTPEEEEKEEVNLILL